jgi:stage III sporulation protein AD
VGTIAHVVGFALVAAILLAVLRQYAGTAGVSLAVRIGAVAVLLATLVGPLAQVLAALDRLVTLAHVGSLYLGVLLKVLGIAYLTTLGAQLAQDVGESALAAKVELVGKVLILVLAVPVVTAIVELVLRLLPSG